jgi:hypothetical protein
MAFRIKRIYNYSFVRALFLAICGARRTFIIVCFVREKSTLSKAFDTFCRNNLWGIAVRANGKVRAFRPDSYFFGFLIFATCFFACSASFVFGYRSIS